MSTPFPDAAAGVYDRGRPPYPPQVIAALQLPPGSRVLDLAAGTGLLSGALAQAGHDVVAVEPGSAMREHLIAKLGAGHVLDGTAEAIPLGDADVDAVTAGDAFHWFDPDRAASEIARVLCTEGNVALVWRWPAYRDGHDSGWRAELGAALARHRGAHPGYAGEQGREGLTRNGAFAPLTKRVVEFTHDTDHAGIVAGVASISFIARLDVAARDAFLAEVAAIVPAGPIAEPYRAEVWLTRLLRRAPPAGRRAAARRTPPARR